MDEWGWGPMYISFFVFIHTSYLIVCPSLYIYIRPVLHVTCTCLLCKGLFVGLFDV